MSFIDTIALPLFILVIGIVGIVFVTSLSYKMIAGVRADVLEQKRVLRLERQMAEFLRSLYIESNSVTSDVTLSPELTDELWKLYNQIDQTKELSR